MGINIILPLIVGMAMTVIISSQVAPSFIEQMKIAKIENKTIENQEIIKNAIIRYIQTKGKAPDSLEELKKSDLLKYYDERNLFDEVYSFEIDEEKGTLKIFTTINNEGSSQYFSKSLKFTNKPTCNQSGLNYNCETFYLLDEDTFKALPQPPLP